MNYKKLFSICCTTAMMTSAGFSAPGYAWAETACATGVDLVIDFRVKADAVPAFEAILGGVAEANARVPGFRFVRVHRDISDDGHFILVEGWDSVPLHQAHHNRLVEIGAWQGVLDMMETPPQLHYTTAFEEACGIAQE